MLKNLLRAAEKYHFDLHQSWMVGDSIQDVEAGRSVGGRTALLGGAEGDYRDLREFTVHCIR